MSQPINQTTTKQVPLDILEVYGFLQDFHDDLSDVMMMSVDEWSTALWDEISAWKDADGPQPGWQSFRNWLNDICREDVLPRLFPDPPLDKDAKDSAETDPRPAGFVAGKGDAYDYLPTWMALPPLYFNENNPNPLAIIKLFTPDSSWSWFLMESDSDGLLFALVVGLETEFGYAQLEELKSVTGPLGLHIERDRWFRPTPVRDLPEYRERWGSGGPYPGGSTSLRPSPEAPTPLDSSTRFGTPQKKLPDGWTSADIRFLLEMLEEDSILVADSQLGIPTIHNNFGAETHHLGFGLMQVESDRYTLHFDAGGAMRRTPSGNGWTKLTIKGQYNGYDRNTVRLVLTSWLPEIEEPHPWQMTRQAYQEQKAIRVAGGVPVLNGADGKEHEQLVQDAIQRAEVVPAEVLADYPDLQTEFNHPEDPPTQ